MAQPNAAAAVANLFKTPELKQKIGFTLLALLVYRIGAHVTAPGIDVVALVDFFKNQQQGGLLGLYDLFVGGGLSRATLFALGIVPYISSSIVFQIFGAVIPSIEKKIRSDAPLPTPRSVICSPSHMTKIAPVVRKSVISMRKPNPGFRTAPCSDSVNSAKPYACTIAMPTVR